MKKMKIAVITGASSGMGQECAIQIADRFRGLDEIWLIARRAEYLNALERKLPVPVRKFALDLTEDSQLTGLLRQTLAEWKPEVKILVNAAGYGKIGEVGTIPLKEETGMVRLNCEALCAVTHIVLPYMPRNSRIIQFASSAAFLPQPGFSVYAATKAFVLSYSRAINREVKDRKIFCTAVCPGPVKTEFFNIAETYAKMPLYKKLAMADPKKVVKKAIRDSMMGKPVSVYGGLMKIFFVLTKIIPHEWLLKIVFCRR